MSSITEFQVNTYTNSTQEHSVVTSLPDGEFVVTWQSDGKDGSSSYDIFGQRYNADGTVNGGEIQINTYITDYQRHSDVTSLPDGGFVVTWTSRGQDGSSWGIFGQRYSGVYSGNVIMPMVLPMAMNFR